jgi:serine/threonine protein phosphatase 1
MPLVHAFSSATEAAPRRAEPGTTLFAVGDVHGCAVELDAMVELLARRIDEAQARGQRCVTCLLGDYIDRGPNSFGVLRRLPRLSVRLGGTVHLLRGNHDQLLLDALRKVPAPGTIELWCANGGERTMAQLGVEPYSVLEMMPEEVGEHLRDRLGAEMVTFLQKLQVYHEEDAYLFVHAGVHPRRALAAHSLEDLLWLRDPFLNAEEWPHPFTVVHGHTPLGVEVLPHRVGLDSACFFTGVLSAAEIENDQLRLHAVTRMQDLDALEGQLGLRQPRAYKPAGSFEIGEAPHA